MNIVTRVALEGRAKPGDDGAAIKMFLKVRHLVLNGIAGVPITTGMSRSRSWAWRHAHVLYVELSSQGTAAMFKKC